MRHKTLHQISLLSIGFFLGAASILAMMFPGTEPQAALDIWSAGHFLFGVSLGYLGYTFGLNGTIFRHRLSTRWIITLSMIIQLSWKAYEYVFGTSLFLASLSNCMVDIITGFIGSLSGVCLGTSFAHA